jgi:hypothetical protein
MDDKPFDLPRLLTIFTHPTNQMAFREYTKNAPREIRDHHDLTLHLAALLLNWEYDRHLDIVTDYILSAKNFCGVCRRLQAVASTIEAMRPRTSDMQDRANDVLCAARIEIYLIFRPDAPLALTISVET